jgi:hypothetical protein
MGSGIDGEVPEDHAAEGQHQIGCCGEDGDHHTRGEVALSFSLRSSSAMNDIVSLSFNLDVQDGWPPVAVESLPFRKTGNCYLALSAPLFVKDLSADDLISVRFSENLTVTDWKHISRSGRTTIWLLRLKRPNNIEHVLSQLRELGCSTSGTDTLGSYAIDVPVNVPISHVDSVLGLLDETVVATAFPSMRHPEESEGN